jgi:6-phosphogluconate dehydrogenase
MNSIAIAGMGKMGANMALRLLSKGIKPVVWNRTPEKTAPIAAKGAAAARTPAEAVSRLKAPRTVWLMLPAGEPTETLFLSLLPLLERGDMIIDGSNSNWKDAPRRAEKAAVGGVDFLDAGVSGGVWGLAEGYCIMAGGSKAAFEKAEPFLKALCQTGGCMHCGAAGAGHFVKMAHNAIEYGMMEAYGEGFELLKASPYGGIDMAAVAALWNRGSVIRSWLLELARAAFEKDPGLEKIAGRVPDSGEARWAVEEAARLGVPLPAIASALFRRFDSQVNDPFGNRLSSALRHEFGGHEMTTRTKDKG